MTLPKCATCDTPIVTYDLARVTGFSHLDNYVSQDGKTYRHLNCSSALFLSKKPNREESKNGKR